MPMIVGYGRPRAVISGSVSASLRRASSASSARPDEQLVERGDALAAPRRVRRAARDGQPERDRAGMRDDDVEVRWLRDDRQVAGRAGPDRRERPLPAILLGRDQRDDQLAVEPVEVARRAEGPHRRQDRGHAALHVAGAAAEHRPIADLAGPRVGGPRGEIARRHDVEVARQDDPPPAGAPGASDDDRQRASAASPRPASPGRRGRRPGRASDLDREPELAQRLGRPGRDGLLGPVMLGIRISARRSSTSRSRSITAAGDHADAQPRRMGRVRQVGPPEPLIPISVAG